MKTLVFGLNWIGDVIMSFPALASAAIGTGQKIDILTRPHLAPLYKLHPGIGKIWEIPTQRAFWRILPELRILRAKDYDTILILPHSFRAAWLAFLAGGRRRIGFAAQGRSILLHEAVALPADVSTMHESRLWENLVSKMGIPDRQVPLPTVPAGILPSLPLLRERLGIPQGEFAVLAPGAAFGPAKQWPERHFFALAQGIRRQFGFPIILTGSTTEKPQTARLTRQIGAGAIDLGGRTDLLQLISILHGSQFVVANDSGTMHLAALAKVPLVVPFGATDDRRTGPLSPMAVVIHGSEACPTQPCRKARCDVSGHPCLNSVTPDMVLSTIKRLLLKLQRGGPVGSAPSW